MCPAGRECFPLSFREELGLETEPVNGSISNPFAKILLVEDDERVRREVHKALDAQGFEVTCCGSVRDARIQLSSSHDLLVLDLGLPDGDGLDLCRSLRAAGQSVPILVLTARGRPEDRVGGLDVGADDYLVKPFFVPELIARIRSILRRTGQDPVPSAANCGALCVDSESRLATMAGQPLDLKPKEFELLLFLMRHPGRAWSREQLLDRVWGTSFDGGTRTVDLHVTRLRKRIEEDPGDPRYIRTVWGVGYRMTEDPEGSQA